MAVNQETVPAEGEIKPRFDQSLAHIVDDLCVAQQKDVVADNLPRDELGEFGELPRSVRRSFVDQFMASGTLSEEGDNSLSLPTKVVAEFRLNVQFRRRASSQDPSGSRRPQSSV